MTISLVDSNQEQIKPEQTSDFLPLIPPGEYRVAFDYYETAYHFGKSPKLTLHFHVIDLGPYFETKLNRWYSVEWIGKPSRGGTFKVKSQTSIFLIEYMVCLPMVPAPRRLDRIPMSEWPKHAYRASICSVTRNSRQVSLPAALQYSKIESLLGVSDE